MPYVPNLGSPQQFGPQYSYNGQPVPSNANKSGDPAQFPQWNPFNSRDVYNQQQSLGQNAFQQGQDWQNQFAGDANYNQNMAGGYGQTVQDLYSPIWNGGGGYTQDQQNNILQSQGLQDVADQLPGNQLTEQERQGIQGDPNSAYNNFTQNYSHAVEGAANNAGDQVQGVVGQYNAYSTPILQYGRDEVARNAANPGLTPTAEYLRQAGMSDQQVNDIAESAARGVGAQYGSAQDQVRQNAIAAGNTSPMALASAMGALTRNSAASQADALTKARLDALADQRQAATGIQNTQLQAGQYQAGLGTQAGLGIMNSALQNNQFQTGAASSAGQYAGNQKSAAAQFNANMGTGLQSQAEQNASNRAAQIAGNRQSINQGNQQTQLGINSALSGRYQQAYQPWVAAQQEGRQAAVGQQAGYQGQANQANNFRLQGQQITNNATGGAASGYSNWGSTGGQGFGDFLKKSTANSLGQWAGPSGANAVSQFAHGGLLDHHQLIEVGEGNRPEVILPLDPSTEPMKRNVWEKMGAHLGAAMGVTYGSRHHAFGH